MWHCRLPRQQLALAQARYYAYRVNGPAPRGPNQWHAFDPEKILLDPYAKALFFPPEFSRERAKKPGSNAGQSPLGVLAPRATQNNLASVPPPRHYSDAIIYEMHVRGFTASPGSGVAAERRGTFAGIIEKIPYLVDLGVTIVELMPVHQFDPQENNYWGYITLSFFCPHLGYASQPEAPVEEFRELVSALHSHGIEVILDVVYNHTTEADHQGPTYSFKGIDNAGFYLMTSDPTHPYETSLHRQHTQPDESIHP